MRNASSIISLRFDSQHADTELRSRVVEGLAEVNRTGDGCDKVRIFRCIAGVLRTLQKLQRARFRYRDEGQFKRQISCCISGIRDLWKLS